MEKLTMMERLFVEVFDRKSRIESQLYQQFESYGQSLAYNIIADGGCPPPWLWEMGPSASVFSNNGDLIKEQLISETLFPFPASKTFLADQNTQLNMSDMKCGSKCNPSKLLCGISALDKSLGLDLRDNPNILLNQDNNSECNVVESRSEIDVLDWVPGIRSHKICSESLVCKMDKIINCGRKGRTENQKERKTMSRIESENAGFVDSFSSPNKDLDLVNGGVGRVTRSRSRLSAQKQNSSGKSFGAKASTLVKDYANLPPECQTDMHPLNLADLNCSPSDNVNDVDMVQVYGSNAANDMLGKAKFDKSFRFPGIPVLVEPLMANLNGIESCQACLNETPNSSVSVPQTQEGPSRKTMSNHASHVKQMQVQQCDLSDAELVSGVVEVDMVSNGGIEKGSLEFIVDKDCECAPHCDSIWKLPEMPVISSALSPAGDGVPISCKDSCRNQVDNPSITRETSPGISKTHVGGRQLGVKLKTVVGGEALLKVESSPIFDRAHLQFDISEGSGCKRCSVVALNSSKRSACCDVVSSEIDDCKSGKKRLPCGVQDSMMEIPYGVGGTLAVETNLTGKVDRLPMELQGGRDEICEVADPGFFMVPASNVHKLSDTTAGFFSCPESCSSKHACSAQVTGSMVGSYLGCLDNTPMLCGSEEPLLEGPLKCLTKNRSMDYHLEEVSERYRDFPSDSQYCSISPFTIHDKGLPQKEHEISSRETVKRSIKFPIKTPNLHPINNGLTLDEHYIRMSDDNDASSCKFNASALLLVQKSNLNLSAEETSSGTNSLQIKDPSVKKTSENAEHKSTRGCYILRSSNFCNNADLLKSDESIISCPVGSSMLQEADKVETFEGTTENLMPAKFSASIDAKSYSAPSAPCHFLKSSTVNGTKLPSYWSKGDCRGIELKRLKKTSNHQFHCSWPNRTKVKHKYSLATSPWSSSCSFLDIKQQIEHKCKASSTTEAILVQFSSKLTDCFMQSSVPPETKRSHMLQDRSDSNSNIHDLVILPNEVNQNKSSQMEEAIHTYNSSDEKKPCNLNLESKVDHSSGGSTTLFASGDLLRNETSKGFILYDASNEAKEPCDAPQPLFSCGITGLSCAADEKTNYDETMPTFERFNIDIPYLVQDNAVSDIADIPSLAKERIFVLEQLRQSRVLLTPNYAEPSELYEVDGISDDLDSSSLGLLEAMKLDYSLEHKNAYFERLSASFSNSLMGICCKYGSQPDHPVLERSHFVSSTSVGLCSETRNPPLTPPVLKFSHGKLSGKKSSSSEKMNSKPELICFRIDENSSTTEENADFFQVNFSSHRASPRDIGSSKNSTALSDVTAVYQNTTSLISNLMELEMRDSLESVISDADSSLLCLGNGKSKIENAENQKHSDKENRFRETVRSISNMSVKSKVSCKSSQRIRKTRSTGKSSKPSNIISDIASFVPHVQQKQRGPLLHGKKDIKVKALEAAEVAKRLEVKKQIERETRKATVKLRRERLEQENAKQLKLNQKQEEEKRKKEVDIGGKKRQRKEEDKKAKQCKRQCKVQSRTLHRGSEDKMPYQEEKDFQKKAADDKQKLCAKITNVKGQKELEEAHQLAETIQQYTINAASISPKYYDDKFKDVDVSDDGKHIAKGVDCADVSQEAVENLIPGLRTDMDLQSYEMSPYQSSDDEEVEECSWREQKFVPLWARRESLGQVILSNQHLDPKEIFSSKQSFSLSKVLCSRVLTRPWR